MGWSEKTLLCYGCFTSCKLNWREVKKKVTQSCQTLCNPLGYRVHGIIQARILEWAAFHFSRGSSQPRDWTQVSHIAGGFFTTESQGKPLYKLRKGDNESISSLHDADVIPAWLLNMSNIRLNFLHNIGNTNQNSNIKFSILGKIQKIIHVLFAYVFILCR